MSWFRNREGREGREAEEGDVKPRNQILQTPEKEDAKAQEKLDSGDDSKKSFEDRIRVNPSDLNNQQPEKKKLDSSSDSDDPNKGQRELERPTKNRDDDGER